MDDSLSNLNGNRAGHKETLKRYEGVIKTRQKATGAFFVCRNKSEGVWAILTSNCRFQLLGYAKSANKVIFPVRGFNSI